MLAAVGPRERTGSFAIRTIDYFIGMTEETVAWQFALVASAREAATAWPGAGIGFSLVAGQRNRFVCPEARDHDGNVARGAGKSFELHSVGVPSGVGSVSVLWCCFDPNFGVAGCCTGMTTFFPYEGTSFPTRWTKPVVAFVRFSLRMMADWRGFAHFVAVWWLYSFYSAARNGYFAVAAIALYDVCTGTRITRSRVARCEAFVLLAIEGVVAQLVTLIEDPSGLAVAALAVARVIAASPHPPAFFVAMELFGTGYFFEGTSATAAFRYDLQTRSTPVRVATHVAEVGTAVEKLAARVAAGRQADASRLFFPLTRHPWITLLATRAGSIFPCRTISAIFRSMATPLARVDLARKTPAATILASPISLTADSNFPFRTAVTFHRNRLRARWTSGFPRMTLLLARVTAIP